MTSLELLLFWSTVNASGNTSSAPGTATPFNCEDFTRETDPDTKIVTSILFIASFKDI
jgi:hypothetical protein